MRDGMGDGREGREKGDWFWIVSPFLLIARFSHVSLNTRHRYASGEIRS